MKQKNGRRGTIQCREDLIPDCDKHAVPRSATMPWCQTGVGRPGQKEGLIPIQSDWVYLCINLKII